MPPHTNALRTDEKRSDYCCHYRRVIKGTSLIAFPLMPSELSKLSPGACIHLPKRHLPRCTSAAGPPSSPRAPSVRRERALEGC